MTNLSHYYQQMIEITTTGRGSIDISHDLNAVVDRAGIVSGLCHTFIHHTSASLMLCENADPDVRRDLETFMSRLVPDGDPMFIHTSEGPDDMPAHVRSILTHSGLTIPVINQRLGLGTWQGAYLWEHRQVAHTRRLTITVHGLKTTD